MTARHCAGLAELAELGLALARDLQGRALAASDADEAAQLTAAFHRTARSVRQTYALEARLRRDLDRAAREAEAQRRQDLTTRIERRKAQVRLAVERLIWTEVEDDEAEVLVDELVDRLEQAGFEPGFADEDVAAQVARLKAELGLAEPAAEPRPAAADPPAAPAWRSSA